VRVQSRGLRWRPVPKQFSCHRLDCHKNCPCNSQNNLGAVAIDFAIRIVHVSFFTSHNCLLQLCFEISFMAPHIIVIPILYVSLLYQRVISSPLQFGCQQFINISNVLVLLVTAHNYPCNYVLKFFLTHIIVLPVLFVSFFTNVSYQYIHFVEKLVTPTLTLTF
jgi:hypothetical protein